MRALSRFTDAPFRRRHAFIRQVYHGFATYTRLLEKTQQPPFIPSPEQKRIAEASRTTNVIVSAQPGSGKTSTVMAIIEANPTARILVMTYCRQAREEASERFKEYSKCYVYTYHQTAQLLYGIRIPNDTILFSLRDSGIIPESTLQPPDIIIFDELQDCTPILFWFSCMLINYVMGALGGRAPRLVALGDERQAIHGFRGADARYLSLCSLTFGPYSPYPWVSIPLSKSFRLSHENSRFINETFLGGKKYLIGSHTGPKPIYICAILTEANKLAKELVPLIRQYGPENTAILASFVRKNPAVQNLSNLLSGMYRFGVAVSTSDDMKLDKDVTRGKICVSTYHQFKGSERPLVIVYGVDETYFQYFGDNLSPDTLPNEAFVACTRAKKQLVILQSARRGPMPCARTLQLHKTATCISLAMRKSTKFLRLDDRASPIEVSAAVLARHIPEDILKSIVDKHMHIAQVAVAASQPIYAPDKALTNKYKQHYEAVSDLNGIVVVAAYEYKLRKSLVTLNYDPDERPIIPTNKSELIRWFFKKACDYKAKESGYNARKNQLTGHAFDWFREDDLELATERLMEQLKDSEKFLDFEVLLGPKPIEFTTICGRTPRMAMMEGYADIVINEGQKTSIWEIKFKSELSLCDAVQLVIYAYLYHVSNPAKDTQALPRMYLYNVRTGEKREYIAKRGIAGLETLIHDVLRVKYSPKAKLSDEEFLRDCDQIRKKVQQVWAGQS